MVWSWRARGRRSVADALRGTHDGTADRSLEEAVTIIHEIAGSLAQERANGYLAARGGR